MSNYLAAATVTATLGTMLRDVKEVVPGADVTYLRPDRLSQTLTATDVGVNIYLYRIAADPAFRNADLPTRAAGGRLERRPQTAVNLEYLFSFYGNDGAFEPQRLLGWTVTTLEARPVLTRAEIRQTIDSHQETLGGSTLDGQVELVRISPVSLSLEDISKLWSVFLHAPYLLSTAYATTAILMNPDEVPPPHALPVRTRQLHLVRNYPPVIDTVIPSSVLPLQGLVVTGRYFTSARMRIVFTNADYETSVQVVPDSSTRISLDLPPGLRAGINRVVCQSQYNAGTETAPDWRPLLSSTTAAFVLRPSVTAISVGLGPTRPIVVSADPVPALGQSVTLWLEEVTPPGGEPNVYGLTSLRRTTIADPLQFVADQVRPGTYIARLRVDNAESTDDPQRTVVIQ